MSKIFYPIKWSYYLGEQRPLNQIVVGYQPDPTPPPSPSPTPTPTNTPTPSITPSVTPTNTPTASSIPSTPTPTPSITPSPTPTITPSLTPSPTPPEQFHIQTENSENILTESGDFLDYNLLVFDSDAELFFTTIELNGGSITFKEKVATNQLVLDLKGYGLWSKMVGLYPVIGSTSNSQYANLKDPTQYNLVFNGINWNFSSAGASPGVGAYARTFIDLTTINPSVNGIHFGMYVTENGGNSGASSDFGLSTDVVSNYWRVSSNYFSDALMSVGAASFTVSNGGSSKANWIWTNDITTTYIYKDGSVIGSQLQSLGTEPTCDFYISANHLCSGGFNNDSQRNWALASIGYGMDATEVSNYNTAVVSFQTTLNRNN